MNGAISICVADPHPGRLRRPVPLPGGEGYLPEPTTAAEVLARARAVRERREAALRAAARAVYAQALAQREAARAEEEAAAVAAREAEEESGVPAGWRAPARVKAIVAEVAGAHGVTVRDILGSSKKAKMVAARHAAIRAVADTTGWSLPRLGAVFGGRDHTTILNALRKSRSEDRRLPDAARVAHD